MKKLTTAEAVRCLLDGGYIAEIFRCNYKTIKYKVHQKYSFRTGIADYITPKQFDELAAACLIEFTGSKTDKYGNVCNFHELRR